MTNDTTPTENGAADVAMLAAIQNDTTTASTSDSSAEAAQAEAAEPKPPSFDDMGLHPDVKQALDDMGYFAPTPVQTAVFGPVSAGKDLLVQSRTGTGKTTAFGLPLVNRLVPAHRQPQALILAPTRELALQVARELTQIGKHRGILVEAVYGGAPIGKQIKALKDGVHIIVGTPGRVLDHIGRRTLDCKTISTFVLDECDEMLSMGFLEDIERVTQHLPEKHQTLLFSATMPDEVTRYSRRHMTAPEQISLSRDSVSVSDIHHAYYIVSGIARSRDLLKIIFAEDPESAIVFCNMRDETTMVAKFLQKQGLDAEPLSSDLSQSERERVMGRMKAKNLRFLVATDVAARGIDISNLSHVINFTVPESPEVYVHRTGRTGRAGKKGTAISLVGPRELGNFRYVRLQYGIKPEERVLPKDDIFIGKLKVPLPPVGVPQPPDPVQILIRGVQGQPSDLERQIFEKLLAKSDGKRVLAALVAEKLNQLSTKTSRPRRERPERGEGEAGEERGERGERGERRFDRDRGERPRFGDREERGERGERRFDRDRGERPRFGDREERGERPRFGDREERGERRFDREERGERGERRFDREERGERGERGERRFDREERGERGERGERRFDRDRGERRFDRDRDRDRDRGERRERAPREERPAVTAEGTGEIRLPEAEVRAAETTEVAAREERPAREERHGRRERGERGERRERPDREARREHRDTELTVSEAVPAPVAAAEPAEPAAEVSAEETRTERPKKKDKRATEVTDATREFWETWAESKATREPEPAAAAEEPEREARSERKERGERSGRTRDRGRGRDKASREDKSAREEKSSREDKAEKKSEREERGGRSKREAEAPARATAADGSQARLFVSLGKKHGVSADDLRSLLAGPIGGDTAKIGSVSLRDSHAHVRVPEDLVDDIIAGVHGTLHNEHNVTVERARA